MRSKLLKFTDFARTLLPHETAYLLSVQQFDDKVKLAILEQADWNCRHPERFVPFDEQIDKRKYSNLKQWIGERLNAVDVDTEYEWLLEAEKQIETDRIAPDMEERVSAVLRECRPHSYHFVKCYELAQLFRHFLLIRMRHPEHREVEEFLTRYHVAYEQARAVREQLHRATLDIVQQYSRHSGESMHWEPWLTSVFYDETLDGWNRYMALVRLTFLYYNYRQFEPLREKYDYLATLFSRGIYYSKRLLINYYGNRLLLHTRFHEYDEAEYYGYLSIRVKTTDYIHYANNLCAVLLRRKKYREALAVMKAALPESRSTHSFHNKIGFVAHYLRCLHHTGQHRAAENYADTYLRAYRKEIFEHRWHAFFGAYLEALLAQKNYGKILRLADKYQLLERDAEFAEKSAYLPIIPWYCAVAAHKKQRGPAKQVQELLIRPLPHLKQAPDKADQLEELIAEIEVHVPELAVTLRKHFPG
ncbi:MAG: hypothetical protein H6575_02870 [Lewinellaceae bacterium]|nr:hypothetical protein [Saprospiraceae bacterium]MCB9353491.1 hypothetical protein [Lewinellaceae bacterium]